MLILSSVFAGRFFVSGVRVMTTILANVTRRANGFSRSFLRKLMLSGLEPTLRSVLGVRRRWSDRWVATSWPALAVNRFATCVLSLGSRITRTTLSVSLRCFRSS